MRILLAVDASVYSEAAVNSVIEQFRPANAEVRVYHAVEWLREMPQAFEPRPLRPTRMPGTA